MLSHILSNLTSTLSTDQVSNNIQLDSKTELVNEGFLLLPGSYGNSGYYGNNNYYGMMNNRPYGTAGYYGGGYNNNAGQYGANYYPSYYAGNFGK